jgi:succinoglycan biosynthesis transport protein ExoP
MNEQFSGRLPADDQLEPLALGSLEELEENRQRAKALELDIKAIWSAIYRNRFAIFAILALSVLFGLVSAMLSTPIYRATASIQIEQTTAKVLETEQADPTSGIQDSERFLQTQLDILLSRSQAIKVVEDLGLARNNQFLITMGYAPSDGNIGGLDAAASRRERVIRVVQGNVSVELPRSSRVATINFDSPDPELAARVANSYVNTFIAANLRRRFDTSAYTREFLADQIAATKERLEQSEQAMIEYARGAKLIDTSSTSRSGAAGSQGSAPSSLTMANLVDLNENYGSARAARIQAEQKWQQAQRIPLMNMPEVMSDPLISRLKGERSTAAVELEQNRDRYGDNHPTIVQLRTRVAEFDQQIAAQAQAIRNSIRDAYRLAARQEAALDTNVRQLTQESLAEQDRGIQFNILRREVDTNRAMYDGLLQRYKEVSAAAGITTNNISVIDEAERPTSPVSPNAPMNMFLGGFAGLALALMFVFVREKFDDVIRSPEDIDRKLGLPYLNAIPILEPGMSSDEALDDQLSYFSEAYYALRTAIELASPQGLPRSIFFTSAAPSEGKSTTSFAIARNFAKAGRRTLLIDADLRKPTLHRQLDLSNDVGLSHVLAKQKPVTDAIVKSTYPNLDVITSGKLPPSPAELLSGPALAEMIAALADHYDLLLIDGPPVLGLADAPSISSVTEATVFVIEANRSSRGTTKAALRRLLAARAKVIGAVLTKFDAKRIGYGAQYGYNYYYYYGASGEKVAAAPSKWRPSWLRS